MQQRMPARYLGSAAGLQQMLHLKQCKTFTVQEILENKQRNRLRIKVNNEPGEKQLLHPDWLAPCRYSAVECI